MSRQGKLVTSVLCASAIIGLAVAVVRAQDEPPAAAPDISSLQFEIEALNKRVAQLELRLSQLEGGVQPLEFQYTPDGTQVVPQPTPAPGLRGRRPQGEINGIPYYIIPVREQPRDVIPMSEE